MTFDGGLPTPGYTGSQGTVLAVVVRAKQPGTGTFTFSTGAVRANDGFGTDVLTGSVSKTIVVAAPVTPPVAPVVPTPAAPAPATPAPATTQKPTAAPGSIAIAAPSHPDEERWYPASTARLSWTLPSGVDAVQIGVDTDRSFVPGVTYSPAVSQKEVTALSDGIWYFKLRARKGGSWGPVSTREIRVDAAAPVASDVSLAYDEGAGTLAVRAAVIDVASGMDRYEISVGDAVRASFAAEELADGSHTVPLRITGTETVMLTGYDRAGNAFRFSQAVSALGSASSRMIAPPALVPAGDQIVLQGVTREPETAVTVYLQHAGRTEAYPARSGADARFVVMTSQLEVGEYEAWSVTRESGAESERVRFEATASAIVTLGGHAMKAASAGVAAGVALILLLMGALYVGRRFGSRFGAPGLAGDLGRGVTARVMQRIKKRLEKHLDIMHRTRQARILTREERAIKESLESDLDEVDRAIAKEK